MLWRLPLDRSSVGCRWWQHLQVNGRLVWKHSTSMCTRAWATASSVRSEQGRPGRLLVGIHGVGERTKNRDYASFIKTLLFGSRANPVFSSFETFTELCHQIEFLSYWSSVQLCFWTAECQAPTWSRFVTPPLGLRMLPHLESSARRAIHNLSMTTLF